MELLQIVHGLVTDSDAQSLHVCLAALLWWLDGSDAGADDDLGIHRMVTCTHLYFMDRYKKAD